MMRPIATSRRQTITIITTIRAFIFILLSP
jgi:hypothetical protein